MSREWDVFVSHIGIQVLLSRYFPLPRWIYMLHALFWYQIEHVLPEYPPYVEAVFHEHRDPFLFYSAALFPAHVVFVSEGLQ